MAEYFSNQDDMGRDLLSTAQAKILESQRMLTSILDAVPDLLVVIDRGFKIHYTNAKGHDTIQKPDSEKAKTCYGRFKLLDRPCHNCRAFDVFKTGIAGEMQDVNPIDGRTREIRAFPIKDGRGNVEFVVEYVRDITDKIQAQEERLKLEQRIQQHDKLESLSILAGGIAHDFNNMLSVLTGNVSYALSILKKDDELFEVLSDVLEGTRQAKHLTHQLLTFAKGGEPIKALNNINVLLNQSAKFVTSGAKSKCEFKLADDLWNAKVDASQFGQIINNIVINADQAMPNGGIITIKSENTKLQTGDLQLPEGPYVKISIEDQGVGIHDKYISNIFDPYFTTKQKGNGLGLATAYSIAKRHDGHITVYSELGKGTVFNIYLPASVEEGKKNGKKEFVHHKGHGQILIMDDQQPILNMSKRILKRMGYEITAVTDGAEAILLYREAYGDGRPFDLVILDLTVPGGMGGARTIPELLKIDPNVKAVVSSGYSNDPIMANYSDYGFCGVVPKPFTKDQLAEVLDAILGERA